MKPKSKFIFYFALFSLIILLPLELLLRYDPFYDRQIALALTNITVILLIVFIYSRFRQKYRIILPSGIALVSALMVWLDALGNIFQLYHNWVWHNIWYDDITHFVTGLSLGYIFFEVLRLLNLKQVFNLSWFSLNLYSLSLGMFLVSIYEISEYIGDLWFNTFRVADRFDTPSDMFQNLLGMLIVLVIYNIQRRKIKYSISK